jgi:hypothetical protein
MFVDNFHVFKLSAPAQCFSIFEGSHAFKCLSNRTKVFKCSKSFFFNIITDFTIKLHQIEGQEGLKGTFERVLVSLSHIFEKVLFSIVLFFGIVNSYQEFEYVRDDFLESIPSVELQLLTRAHH